MKPSQQRKRTMGTELVLASVAQAGQKKIGELETQLQFERETKTLIQIDSTYELTKHREYRDKVKTLLSEVMNELLRTHKGCEELRPLDLIERIKEFLK